MSLFWVSSHFALETVNVFRSQCSASSVGHAARDHLIPSQLMKITNERTMQKGNRKSEEVTGLLERSAHIAGLPCFPGRKTSAHSTTMGARSTKRAPENRALVVGFGSRLTSTDSLVTVMSNPCEVISGFYSVRRSGCRQNGGTRNLFAGPSALVLGAGGYEGFHPSLV